jgi:hypothetical protein
MNNANDTYKNGNLQIKSNQTWYQMQNRTHSLTHSLTHPSPRDAAKSKETNYSGDLRYWSCFLLGLFFFYNTYECEMPKTKTGATN